jgi:hypothetical protein
MDISTLVQDERDEFVAFLASLAPEQWDMPSLCTEWTVKQLALHYLSLGETGPGGLVRALVASGFSLTGPSTGWSLRVSSAAPASWCSSCARCRPVRGCTAC